MKNTIITIILLFALFTMTVQQTQAQIPIVSLITGAIKKVIKAIDLKIQREQNKVIWLQNAQKALENEMAKLKLNDIADWTEKQRKLYDDYFQELRKVKNVLTTYQEVKDMVQRQKTLFSEYNTAWGLLRNDKHFTSQELQNMQTVYSNILDESLRNIEQLNMVVTSFSTQMSDGKRLELIHSANKNIDRNVSDLRGFTNHNIGLSLSRARDDKDAQQLKNLYGIK
jgi:hypothetical protein